LHKNTKLTFVTGTVGSVHPGDECWNKIDSPGRQCRIKRVGVLSKP